MNKGANKKVRPQIDKFLPDLQAENEKIEEKSILPRGVIFEKLFFGDKVTND